MELKLEVFRITVLIRDKKLFGSGGKFSYIEYFLYSF